MSQDPVKSGFSCGEECTCQNAGVAGDSSRGGETVLQFREVSLGRLSCIMTSGMHQRPAACGAESLGECWPLRLAGVLSGDKQLSSSFMREAKREFGRTVSDLDTGQQGAFLDHIKFHKERQFLAVGPFLNRERQGAFLHCQCVPEPRAREKVDRCLENPLLGDLLHRLVGKILL